MRQRLGIAAALLRRPRLLILDEPATGLDPAGMRDMRALIRRLADEGITVLLSSHQLPEVQELCDRVAIVDRGRVVYEGALSDLRRQGGAGYRLRTHRRRAGARGPARAKPGSSTRRTVEHGLSFQAEEQRRRRAVAGARRGRSRHPRPDARAGDARGPVLPADRGRIAPTTPPAPSTATVHATCPVPTLDILSSATAAPPVAPPATAPRAIAHARRPSTLTV